MAALTANRDTQARYHAAGQAYDFAPVASDEFYIGALVAIDSADGKLKPAATSTTLTAIGRCEERYTAPVAVPSDKTVGVLSGTFKFANSAAADLIATTEIGLDCYIVDDQTVAKTNGGATRSVAGKVVGVDSDGVWVAVIPFV